MEKEHLVFTPCYLGSLKYFEKLIPFLKNKYRISFLFLPHLNKERVAEAIEYCKKNNYKYIIFSSKIFSRVPIINDVQKILFGKKEIAKIIKKNKIKKIITSYDNEIFSYINKQGVKTLFLQWALSYNRIKGKAEFKKVSPIKIKVISYLNYLKKLIIKILSLNFSNLLPYTGYVNKVGVINDYAYKYYSKRFDHKKISVVGYLDFYLAERAVKTYTGAKQKKALKQKYSLAENKKNILVLNTPQNMKDIQVLSDEEQYNFTKKIVDNIWSVFKKDEINLLFKIHPAENINLYKDLKKEKVQIFDKDAINEELIFLTDLYIAFNSTTNFISLIMKKDCIFINFLKLEHINSAKKALGIKKFVNSWNEFIELLNNYKKGQLKKQYKNLDKIIVNNSLEKIIKWID